MRRICLMVRTRNPKFTLYSKVFDFQSLIKKSPYSKIKIIQSSGNKSNVIDLFAIKKITRELAFLFPILSSLYLHLMFPLPWLLFFPFLYLDMKQINQIYLMEKRD